MKLTCFMNCCLMPLSYMIFHFKLLSRRVLKEFRIIYVMMCPTFVGTLRKQMCQKCIIGKKVKIKSMLEEALCRICFIINLWTSINFHCCANKVFRKKLPWVKIYFHCYVNKVLRKKFFIDCGHCFKWWCLCRHVRSQLR